MEARTRPLVVLAAVLVCLLLVFGIRTWMHVRATGSTGFRGVSGRPGSLTWLGGVSFVLALALTVLAPVMVWLGVDPLFWPPRPLSDAAAGLAALAGVAGVWWSQGAMGKSWRIGVDGTERTQLVREGPFGLVRNPIFTFMVLGELALVLALPSVAAIAALALLVVAIELQVRVVEEPYLHRMHGEAYAAYCREVGRFVPWLGRERS